MRPGVAVSRERLLKAFDGSIALASVLLLALAWSVPVAQRIVVAGDYPEHLRIAAEVAEAPRLPAPHFLYFLVVAVALRVAPGLTVPAAGAIATTGFMVATAAAVWWYLGRVAPRVASPVRAALTLALLAVGPVPWPGALDIFMIGFFVPNPYHNATILAAKPFALLLALSVAAAIGSTTFRVAPWQAAAVVCLSAVSKPNYVLCAVPAMVLMAAASPLTGQRPRWSVLAAIAVSATLIVAVFQVAYSGSGVRVMVAPFETLRFHTNVDATLAGKLVASLAFPIVVMLLWPKRVGRQVELQVAWVAMAIAILQGYLLAESGPRIDHANLLAGASLASFVLMVTSAAGSLPDPTENRPPAFRLLVAAAVFALHLWGGFRHLLLTMMTPERWMSPLTYAALLVAATWAIGRTLASRERGHRVVGS